MNYFLSIFGIFFLIFRIWLSEFKLKEELQFRRHYLSRIVSIHLCFCIAFSFESGVFNAIILTTFPIMILTTVWDVNFFTSFNKRKYWKKNRAWLIIERLTLHPPVLLIGLYLYLSGGFLVYIPKEDRFFSYIIGMLLVYVPFFILDDRWASKYNFPQAIIMIVLMISSTFVIIILGLFVIYGSQI